MATTVLLFGQHHPKIDQELEGKNPDAPVNVIIQYKQQAQQRHVDAVTRRGGQHKGMLHGMKGAVFSIAPKALADVANDPDVERIVPDREVRSTLGTVYASLNYDPVNNYVNSISSWKGIGIGIAFIDSGAALTHPDFNKYQSTTSRIVYSQSFIDSTPADLYGHGTHVMGIAAGNDNTSVGQNQTRAFWGAAPDASIINLKALDVNGKGTDSAVIAAIDKAISLKSTYNIRVMNLSLGRPVTSSYKTDLLCQAVERAWNAGIVVVVAAGNEGRNNSVGNQGYATITSPGNDPYVITVGAVNQKSDWDRNNDVIATYSSKGPTAIDHIVKPDLVAAGNRVTAYQSASSTLVTSFPGNRPAISSYLVGGPSTPSPYFFQLSGTSMAAPAVSGVIAVLIQKDSTLTPDQVKARLMRTAWRGFPATTSTYDPAAATTYTANHDLFTVGAGQVDAWAAFNDTNKGTGTAASPIAIYDSVAKTSALTRSDPPVLG